MTTSSDGCSWQKLAVCTVPSETGSEYQAVKKVAAILQELRVAEPLWARLKATIIEVVCNACEYSVRHQADASSLIQVGIYTRSPQLADQPSARGWGFFLIERRANPVDSSEVSSHHLLELYLYQEGEDAGHA